MNAIIGISAARIAAGIAALTVAAACPEAFALQPGTHARPAIALPSAGLVVQRNLIELRRLHSADSPPSMGECEAQLQVPCYNPAQVQRAYDVGGLFARHIDGQGQTIVLVETYGSPTIRGDLATFDNQTGLPPADLKVIAPLGAMPRYDPGDTDEVGSAAETTLDAEWAHVLAPGARLVVLEITPINLFDGLQYAIDHRVGHVISLSWSSPEEDGPGDSGSEQFVQAESDQMFRPAARAHITILDATGDEGASFQKPDGSFYTHQVVAWPATDPDVVAVGGSTLHLDDSGNRTSPDTVWNDTFNQAANNLVNGDNGPSPLATGGGRSLAFGLPSYQAAAGRYTRWRRGIPDIVMSGACSGSVNVYSSFGGQPPGWTQYCGTSESTPLFAGVVALADQAAGHPLGMINAILYKIASEHLPGIVPVTSGNNTVTFTQGGRTITVSGYSARHGYSMAAGLGTIDARYLVPELAHTTAAPPAPHPKPEPSRQTH